MRRSHLGSLPACRKGKVVRDEHCPQFSVGDASIPSNVLQNSFIAVYRSSQLRNTPSNGKICESRQNESRHATPPFDPGDPSWTDSTGKSSPRWKRMDAARSEEHTSELQSLMRISYAVFCLKKKKYI